MRQRPRSDQRFGLGFADQRFLLVGSVLLVILFLAALPAAAQSEWQLYGGGSFYRAQTSPYLAPYSLNAINEWGWQSDISEYPWHWFGGTFETSGFYAHPSIYDPTTNQTYSNLLSTRTYTAMFGPSFAYKHYRAFQPFAHILLGGVNQHVSLTSKADPLEIPTGYTPSYSSWSFGWALGGGGDIRVSKLVAIRAAVDYLPTSFKNFNNDHENNLRISFGLVFRFGNEASSNAKLKPAPLPPPSSTPQSTDGEAENRTAQAQALSARNTQPIAAASPGKVAAQVARGTEPATTNTAPGQVAMAQPSPAPPVPQPEPNQASALVPGGASAKDVAAPAQPIPAMQGAAPTAMVDFWSRPSGADVEIDGKYVGSTFSTIAVAPGEHVVTIRKQDFATWQKTITVTSGNVRVAAYLDQVRATVTFH